MSDFDDIRALQLNYAKFFDARDVENYAGLYTEDAELRTPWGHEIRGREKIRKSIANTPPSKGWHKPGETTLNIDGDTAEGVCQYEAMDGAGSLATGRYVDTYRRTPQGWRIASRQVIVERRVPPEEQAGGGGSTA